MSESAEPGVPPGFHAMKKGSDGSAGCLVDAGRPPRQTLARWSATRAGRHGEPRRPGHVVEVARPHCPAERTEEMGAGSRHRLPEGALPGLLILGDRHQLR